MEKEQALQTLRLFLTREDSHGFHYVTTQQGPGYSIELYCKDELSIYWGEDDEDLGLKAFSVGGEGFGYGFSRAEVDETDAEFDARCEAACDAYEAHIEDLAIG
jgi:hypothetical protein